MPTPTPKAANGPTVKFTLSIPEHLYDSYAERAAKHGRTAEDEIALRLKSCLLHVDTTPIYFNDAQRNELSQIAGRLLKTADDVIGWSRRLASLKVDNVSIPLSDNLLQRLHSRTFGTDWPVYINHKVNELLEQEVGLR